jgi:predicted AAA+ superfamily ATPase
MNAFLWQTYHRLIADVDTIHYRFLYQKLDLSHPLVGILGPRGVGKTTLLLQYLKNHLYQSEQAFYFSADNIYFNDVTLLDFVDQLYQNQGIKTFFIDEIHKYSNWSQELKNIYDSFPKVNIVFSGSSSIDLIEGTYDLSRRAKLLHLPGLSFREYLNIKTDNQLEPIPLQDLLEKHQSHAARLSQIASVTKHFEEYMLFGYYPIVFRNRNDLYPAIANVIDKTIYEDIANFYNLKTVNLGNFKRIINFLASIPPGNINTNNLASHLSIDHKTANHYLEILQRTGMIKMLFPNVHGNKILRKPTKIYLDNTTLLAAVNTFLSSNIDLGTQRELAFLQMVTGASIPVFYAEKGDFQIGNTTFEVGGKNKTHQQLKTVPGDKIIVKDNILIGSKNEIPLYLFGFLY